MKTLPLTALATALALAACSPAPQTTDNAMVNTEDTAELNDAAFDDAAPVVEDVAEDTTEAVAVAAVPKPAAAAPAEETTPLNDAGTIEREIRDGRDIQRVRYGDGWAWTRGGQILRTADRDGGNVAYFRRGERTPFFVQRGDRSYAYQGDRPVREFDRDGRSRAPDADRTREAEQAARDARDHRDHAEQARDRATRGDRGQTSPRPNDDRGNDRPDRGSDNSSARPHGRPDTTPTPTPSPSPTTRGGHDPNDRPGGWTRPTPTPTATDRPHRDRH